MSTAKKNKGRDPAAFVNDSITSRLIKTFLEMHEVDYVRNVVIPVLEAEGYEQIDFHHGNTEVGKDLILSKDTGFGKKSLVVAVIKTDSLSKSSSGESGLPVILVQVDQAKRNEVVCWDGTKKRPDKVLVILADDPSHDIISSNPGGFQDRISEGVEFILGTNIATSLIKYRSDIAEQLLEMKLDTSVFLAKHPTNLPLLHALHSNELVNIQSIFTDLDAAVGSTTISHALSLRPSGITRVLIPNSSWNAVSFSIKEIEKILGNILTISLEHVEQNYLTINQKAQSQENKEIYKGLTETVNDIQNWISTLRQNFEERKFAINNVLKSNPRERQLVEALKITTSIMSTAELLTKVTHKFKNQRNVSSNIVDICDELAKFHNNIENSNIQLCTIVNKANTITHTALSELVKSIEREEKNSKDIVVASKSMLSEAKRFVTPAIHEIEFDVENLNKKIETLMQSFVNRFKSNEISTNKIYARKLLEDVHQYLAAIDLFVSTSELASILQTEQSKENTTYNLSACILGLLNSGMDVLVTGNAGSGKSTTLEMFARQHFYQREQTEQIIFLPLAKISHSDITLSTDEPINIFYNEVAKLYRTTQPGVTNKFVKDQVERSTHLLLVLDGIDEALNLVDWLFKIFKKLKNIKGDAIQIVASSRFGVPDLEKTGLFRIQLLPFRKEQVKLFVKNFLNNEPDLADEVIEHLKRHPNMFAVAQTPLMSTILCVLAQNGVILPETMSALYKERFELLWGAYDAKKQVRRVKSSKTCLEDVSKKAAYYLHSCRIRSSKRENILAYILENLVRKYKPEVIRIGLEELERPCNVLVEEIDGTIGFGHLSYQEYLASDELYTNRSSEIIAHLTDSWWRGVLVLAAMKSEDIGLIIEQRIVESGDIGASADTLQAMIDASNPSQKKILSNLLHDQKKLDHIVPSYGDDDLDYI